MTEMEGPVEPYEFMAPSMGPSGAPAPAPAFLTQEPSMAAPGPDPLPWYVSAVMLGSLSLTVDIANVFKPSVMLAGVAKDSLTALTFRSQTMLSSQRAYLTDTCLHTGRYK